MVKRLFFISLIASLSDAYAAKNSLVSIEQFNTYVVESCTSVDVFTKDRKIRSNPESNIKMLRMYSNSMRTSTVDQGVTPFPWPQLDVRAVKGDVDNVGIYIKRIFNESSYNRFEYADKRNLFSLNLDRADRTAVINVQEFPNTTRRLTTTIRFEWPSLVDYPYPTSMHQQTSLSENVWLGWGKSLRQKNNSKSALTLITRPLAQTIYESLGTTITRFNFDNPMAPFKVAVGQEARIFRLLFNPYHILYKLLKNPIKVP